MRSDEGVGRSARTISWRNGVRGLLVVLAAAFAALQAQAAPYVFGPDPAWAELDTLPKSEAVAPASDGSRYLAVVDQVDLNGPRPVWQRRVAFEVTQQRALASAGQFTLQYQPEYQQVVIHAIDVWRGGQRLDRSKDSRIEVLRREAELETRILDGSHTLSVTIPDLRVGDRIDYRYSIIGANPVFGAHYFDAYRARYGDPLGLRRVRFRYPSDLTLYWNPPVAGFEVRSGEKDGLRTLDFVARDLRRVRSEDNLPSGYDPYGSINVSTTRDWKAVSDWALPLYRPVFADRKLAAELVAELKLGQADAQGSLLRAIAFVQGEIRYTGLDLGQNSHAPNSPETTVARRFGDCKDKAVLLVALLREAGIESEAVLVDTQRARAVKSSLPSALAFNHVVVRAHLGGDTYWVDATRDRETGRMVDRAPLPFGYGLPIAAATRDLVEIPDPSPELPLVEVSEDIRIKMDGERIHAGFGVATHYRRGYGEGTVSSFEDDGAEEVGRSYLDYMAGIYEGLESARDPVIHVAKDDNAARTIESYRLSWDKSETTVFGIVLFQLGDWLPTWKNEKRVGPIELKGPAFARQSIRTRLDDGWDITTTTETVENRYFRFSRNVRVVDGDLLVTGEWRRFADQVPARDYAATRRDLEKARELLDFDVDLNASYAITKAARTDWIWPLLAVALAVFGIAWAWLRRSESRWAGMFFRPGRTSIALVALPDSLAKGLLICLVASLVAGAMEAASRDQLGLDAESLGYLVGWTLSYALKLGLFVGLLKSAFHTLSYPVRYRDLLVAGCWAMIPGTFLLACAMLALAGRLTLFGTDAALEEGDLPGLLVAGLLALLAIGWSAFSAWSAYAGAAGRGRGVALGAIMLAGLFFVMLALCFLAMASAFK